MVDSLYRVEKTDFFQSFSIFDSFFSFYRICAELLTGEVLFKGSDHIQQVMLITQLCGTPDEDFLSSLEPNSQNFMRTQLGKYDRQNFNSYFYPKIADHIMNKTGCNHSEAFNQINPKAIDFLDSLLQFDPDKRPSAQQALQHPYLAEYYYAQEDDLDPENFIDTKDFEGTDQTQMEVNDYKIRAWELLSSYKNEFVEKACKQYAQD